MNTEKWSRYFLKISENKKKRLRRDIRRFKRLGLLNMNRGLRILDLCSGCGDTSMALEKCGFNNIFGLELLETLVKRSDRNYRIQVGNCLSIGYKSNSFDIVLVNASLHHLKNLYEIEQCLKEVKRVLKDGSYFLFCEPTNTIGRIVGSWLLFSSLSNVFKWTKDRRIYIEEERTEYLHWLRHRKAIFKLFKKHGFIVESFKKDLLHMLVRHKLRKT